MISTRLSTGKMGNEAWEWGSGKVGKLRSSGLSGGGESGKRDFGNSECVREIECVNSELENS